ncbi:MAG: DUF5682 family protein [Mycobacteriales bacterium]
MTTYYLGIRHHGPGSARAVASALDRLRPECVLIEGPPEADAVAGLAAAEGMAPPVALLAYATDDPSRAAFWPFAEFSPEWQALRWALAAGVPVRFCDLRAAVQFAPVLEPDPDGPEDLERAAEAVRFDPLTELARAAGYDDTERWWEDMVEHRLHGPGPFEEVGEAMAALREQAPPLPAAAQRREDQREAAMRTALRRATREYGSVAVVCGAWHVPALATLPPASHDSALLRGLPRTKVTCTWVPWTHGRLAARSGYGAGITSPGWYHHLFTTHDHVVERWLVKVARLLRAEDLPVSSAHVIEATRLAETLAALRGRPLAGLTELTEAVRAVYTGGADAPLALVRERLVVGDLLGTVPADAPTVPLQADLDRLCGRLRLKPEVEAREYDLDLRTDLGGGRSRLLHRLRLLDIDWGEYLGGRSGAKGTFHERWRLDWRPDLAVRVVEASVWGPTVADAAATRVREVAARAETLADLTALVERTLWADLPSALATVMTALQAAAAVDSDVADLLAALPPLARAGRYGDVRGTDAELLASLVESLVVRACVGLPAACAHLDTEAATRLRGLLAEAHAAVLLVDLPELRDRWLDTLSRIAGRDSLHGLLDGWLTRLLRDTGRWDAAEAERRMGLALSVGVPPDRAASWIEGFLRQGGGQGSALLLLHDPVLLGLVDRWISGVPADTFPDVLPLLRRTFGGFPDPERRELGRRLRDPRAAARPVDVALDPRRAALVRPVVALVRGVP